MKIIRRWFARRKSRRLHAEGRSAEAMAVLTDAYGKRYLEMLKIVGGDIGRLPLTINRRS